MKKIEDGRIQCRVKIIGVYKGRPFEYIDPVDSDGSQFYWPPDEENANYEPSEFWWAEGNMSCDCNRSAFIGIDLDCGDTILIDRIEPIEKTEIYLPPLILNESKKQSNKSIDADQKR